MSALQILKSGVVIAAVSTLTANYIRLREDLAQQLKLVALLQQELFVREQRHRDETSYYKAEMRAMENNVRRTIEERVTEILTRVAEDRGIRFSADDTLVDMENALMAGDRRNQPRVTLGSGHTRKPRQPRKPNKPR